MLILLISVFATLPFLALSRAARILHHHQPEAETRPLARRNPCDGLDYPQISLYEDYSAPLCPAPKHLDDQGACEDSGDPQTDCASFCQLTTTYVWARESPFSGPSATIPCAVSSARRIRQSGLLWGTSLEMRSSRGLSMSVSRAVLGPLGALQRITAGPSHPCPVSAGTLPGYPLQSAPGEIKPVGGHYTRIK